MSVYAAMQAIGPLDLSDGERRAIAASVETWTCPHCDGPYHWNGKVYARGRYIGGASTRYEIGITCDECMNDADAGLEVTDEALVSV